HVGANFWKDMEKKMHIEFFDEEGKPGLEMDAGLKVFGAYGRAMEKKSLAVHARNIYGSDSIKYPFFHDKDILEFKSIVLRTSGQDATMSKIRDGFMTTLARRMGLDAQAHRPAVLYINGEYWGLYNIREKISEHFIAGNHGVPIEHIDLLEANGRVKFGQREDYDELIKFVKNNDMRLAKNYEYVKTQVDIQNFIDYEIAIMYFGNTDSGNIRFWRDRRPEGRWRWIVYDQDWAFFNVNHNTVWYLTNPEGHGIGLNFSNALMYNLLKNQEFKDEFVARFAYHLKNTFKTEDVIALIDQFAARIDSEVPADCERWGGTYEGWKKYVQRLRDFAIKRPAILKGYIQQELGLSNQEMKAFDGI
ncbi:MAG: CotH kinase family protein, partial [Mahellales bacterium]